LEVDGFQRVDYQGTSFFPFIARSPSREGTSSHIFDRSDRIIGQWLALDEMMVAFKDTGLKFYNLVDSSGFCIAYPQRHVVVMDSYYGGLPTAELVHEKGMCFIMSCRKDRPTELFANNVAKNLEKGEVNYKSNGRFVAMTWKDRKPFNCMTNCFTGDTMTAESPKIPLVVYHYRTHYGHVDRFDNQQALYSPQTRTTKWTQAYFRAMLKLTLNNSRILYISRTQKQISLHDWTRTIILALKYKHNPSVPKSVLPVGHFPLLLSGWKQRCKMCQKNTAYKCEACDEWCHPECMRAYHVS